MGVCLGAYSIRFLGANFQVPLLTYHVAITINFELCSEKIGIPYTNFQVIVLIVVRRIF